MANWIDKIINRSQAIAPICPQEMELIRRAIIIAHSNKLQMPIGLKIAAFYDLVISAVYYTNITNDGWLYCKDEGKNRLILPFVNCCPVHALKGEFHFHSSSKPTSAKIGQVTTRVLLLFYQELFDMQNTNIKVYKAPEPADAIFLDQENRKVLFAEIKSSPLLTPAISTYCDELISLDKDGNSIVLQHKKTANTNILHNQLNLLIPKKQGKDWNMSTFPLGIKNSSTDAVFAYSGLLELFNNNEFIDSYLEYWNSSFRLYCTKDESKRIFWLTNACGKPNNIKNWDGGVTCISDEKTSVGMDRTDDIKKGIYQVLKLGSEGKPTADSWEYKVGILSNIHPARHFNAYLEPIKDLIWTISKEKNIKVIGDLPPETPLYNLFDGIITFTESYVKDKWVETIISNIQ